LRLDGGCEFSGARVGLERRRESCIELADGRHDLVAFDGLLMERFEDERKNDRRGDRCDKGGKREASEKR